MRVLTIIPEPVASMKLFDEIRNSVITSYSIHYTKLYDSFKEVDFKNRVPFVGLLLVVVAYVFASLDPPKVLFAGFMIYAFSGPVLTLVRISYNFV